LAVFGQRLHLDARGFVLDALANDPVVGTLWSATASVFSGMPHRAPGHAQAFERLRAGHFMHEMAIDIEKAGAILASCTR
jgi:hypothetical protein